MNAKNWIRANAPSLTHKNFRYFWTGQCISLIGTWMQRTAEAWLVYSLTESPFLLGLLGVFQFAPILLFSLFAGVFIDKLPKKKIIIYSQSVLMFQAFMMTILLWSGKIQYWHILLLAFIAGIATTFDLPARQSFFIDLVGKEHLMNAIALNSTIFNLSRIIGPALSGLAMSYLGMKFCFLLNTLSFIAVIYGLFKIKSDDKAAFSKEIDNHNVLHNIKLGLTYVSNNSKVLIPMLFMGVVCTFAMNNNVIVPVLAKDVLHKGEQGYSILLSFMGVGSLIGALTIARGSKKGPRTKTLIVSSLISSIFFILGGFTRNYFGAILIVMFIGLFNLRFLNTANSIIQLNSNDEYRGRVMSIYSLLNAGTTPIGNLFAGTVTEHLGALNGFLMCGLATGLLTLLVIFISRKNSFSSDKEAS